MPIFSTRKTEFQLAFCEFQSVNFEPWVKCKQSLDKLTSLVKVLNIGKISPPFYFRPLVVERIQNWANWILHKGLQDKNKGRAYSTLGDSVSHFHWSKIRQGKFKAVYSINTPTLNIAFYMYEGQNYGQTDWRTIRLLDAPEGPLRQEA